MFRSHASIRWTAALLVASAALLLPSLACSGGVKTLDSADNGMATAPSITQHPQNQTVMAGDTAVFTVAATGSPAPSYQWRKGGTPLSGQNGPQLSLTKVEASDEDTYDVLISNVAGSVASTAATLTVNRHPSFTVQPSNRQVVAPAAALFTVVADGKPAPTLQWESSTNGTQWSPISGATNASYSTGSTASSQNGLQFHCVATAGSDVVTSQPATLLVNTSSTCMLTVNLGAGVTGTPSTGGPYAKGATVPYTFAAASGYSSLQVTLDGNAAPASGSLTMDGNHTLAATATALSHTVTFLAGSGGTLTGTTVQTVQDGKDATSVTAVPSAGKSFVNWTGPGFTTTTKNPLTVTKVTQDETITANFTSSASTYTVTFVAGSGGTISGNTVQSVPAGNDSQPVTAVPAAGMSFVNWTGTGFTTTTTNPLTVPKVSQNLTLTANFASTTPGPVVGPNVGNTVPDITFVDAKGAAHKLSDYKGKVILLALSEFYCDPCRQESKTLQALQDKYGSQGLVIIENISDVGTNHVDATELTQWATEAGFVTVSCFHDTCTPAVPDLMAITGFPTNLLVGRDFVIKSRNPGYSPYTLEQQIVQGLK